jgi:hypothetical protein
MVLLEVFGSQGRKCLISPNVKEKKILAEFEDGGVESSDLGEV